MSADESLDSTAKFDRAELVRGWRAYEARSPRVVPVVKFAAKTDMGQVRENNEDKFDFYEPEAPSVLAHRGCLYAVGDGIGGALAGQIASEMMLKNVIAGYYDSTVEDLQTALHEAIVNTNDRIYHLAQMIPERNGMGTTLVGAVVIEDRVVVMQVGDSRAYLVRDGQITQITHDHSWVEEQVRAGLMRREDAELSPFRNVITRSIGAAPHVMPDFYEERALPGDIWVLCSDGLTGHVGDDEILFIAGQQAPSEAARQLIELANSRGGRDNITVFVVSVRDLLPGAEMPQLAQDVAQAYSQPTSVPTSNTNGAHYAHNDNAVYQTPSSANAADTQNGVAQTDPNRPSWRKIFGR